MVGSTELAQRDEQAALALIEEQERIARAALEAHHGRWVKSTGDGLLAEFPSALDAVECAVEFQRRVGERNARPDVVPLHVRVGLHVGDVQGREGDIFGDAVNVASRVEAAAVADGICVSEPFYAQVRNKVAYRFEPIGARSLKGIAEPMALYRVVVAAPASATVRPATATPRLAVLPLANISPDPHDEYFADGLTEELIAVLSKLPSVRVIARTSVVPYKSSPKSVAQIGAELGVTSILEGSVRKSGDRLRITLQLIDVASQEHIWSEKYDRELADVFAIQTEVAERTASAIRVELSERAREFLRRTPTQSLPAYELYLRAVQLGEAEFFSAEAFRESVALLEGAIERDPDFALAHAQLGHRLVLGAGDYLPHREGFARARREILRALELDPELSEAHAALGNLRMQEDHDWDGARAEFERALLLNPSNAIARVSYGTLLRVLGRHADAEEQFRFAYEVNPGAWTPRWLLIDSALLRLDEAEAKARYRALIPVDLNPMLSHLAFAALYAELGRPDDARRELAAAGTSSNPLMRLARAIVLGTLGDLDEPRALLAELTAAPPSQFVSAEYLPALYAMLGEKEKALDLLEQSVRAGESGLWIRQLMPAFDGIRDDPRFVAMLRSFRLPDEALRGREAARSPSVRSPGTG